MPSRVAVRGQARSETVLIKSTEGSLIELSDRGAPCAGVAHVKVSSLTLEMRASLGDSGKPLGLGGHCIRSGAGASYVELRDLRLSSCNFYGLGFQIAYQPNGERDCRSSSPPYEHLTIEGVHVVRSGSDGVDFKQPERATNTDIVVRDVCVGDVGWNDDGSSAAGFDLAGSDLYLYNVTHVNPAASYDTTGVRTYVSGIRLRSGMRNVTRSLVENFRVSCVSKGVFFEGDDNRSVTLRNGDVRQAITVGDRPGDGIFVRGSGHRTEGDVFVTDVSRYRLVDYGSGSVLALSSSAPALDDAACKL